MTRIALLFVAVALLAQAQTPRSGASPAAQYHTGAQAYIDGDNARALSAVNAGLAAAPDDARLQALRDLIQQQQDEQDNQDGGQQNQQADNSDAGDQGDEGDQGENGDQPPPDQPANTTVSKPNRSLASRTQAPRSATTFSISKALSAPR